MEILHKPWPWYIAGPLIGLAVPLLLLMDDKRLGISSTLRHICAACFPANVSFLKYDWRKEAWNLYFVVGVLVGGFIAGNLFGNPEPVAIAVSTQQELYAKGVMHLNGLMPEELFNWNSLFTIKGLLLMAMGGFMVGFGTRYAGGCTSGHGIFGLSNLQLPSLLATMSFFAGGIIFSYWVLPYILRL